MMAIYIMTGGGGGGVIMMQYLDLMTKKCFIRGNYFQLYMEKRLNVKEFYSGTCTDSLTTNQTYSSIKLHTATCKYKIKYTF